MGNLLDSVFSFFVEEATEHIGVLEVGLLEMEKVGTAESGEMEPLFRAAHTLKGSANLIKLGSVGRISHRMEDLFESVRDGKLEVTPLHIDALLFALDQIRLLIRTKTEGREEPTDAVSLAIERLDAAEKRKNSRKRSASLAENHLRHKHPQRQASRHLSSRI